MIDLSVIIVNFNTRQLLEECLVSLRDTAGQLTLQTIVVDNGSTDGSPEMVSRHFPDVVLIRNQTNEGFASPNNQGLKRAQGRYAMLLNSDTVARPGALERLVVFMDNHPDAGACGPRLVYPDGSLQRSCRNLPSLWRHFCDMSGLENIFPRTIFGNFETRFEHDRTVEVDQPMGAALLVRSQLMSDVGLLDERFKIYYNEVDWCKRIHEAGWKIFFVHDAEIIHHGGKTTELTNQSFQQFDEMNNNTLAYYEKHFGYPGMVSYRILLIFGFSARIVFWTLVSLVRRSDRTEARLLFAKKYFALGARFWSRMGGRKNVSV